VPKVSALLGISLGHEEVDGILKRLQMEVKEDQGEAWVISPPAFRGDITREIDLIEEIGRLKGYDHIPVQTPKMWVVPFRQERAREVEERVKAVLVGLGFYEVITFSFIAPESLQALRLLPGDPRLRPLALLNPLAEVQSVMRTTLLPGLLETARYNLNHKNRDLKIFELREIYRPRAGERLPEERRVLAGLAMGAVAEEGWNVARQEVDFYYAKGCVELILAEVRAPSPTFAHVEGIPYLHPRKGAIVRLEGEEIGVGGELHPEVAHAFELPEGVLVFELDLATVADRFSRDITFTPLPRFPSVVRDVAVTVDEGMSAGEIMQIIRGVNDTSIEAVEVFDRYQGDPIPGGRKGLAYRITYRSPDRTLTDEEVNEIHQGVLARLEQVSALTIR
jgi:phenylalanyl-tRNA synthetase beta chain